MNEQNENRGTYDPQNPDSNARPDNDGQVYRSQQEPVKESPSTPSTPYGYHTYDSQPPEPPRPPQQYSPNNGWQRPDGGYSSTPQEPYQWKMSDYEGAGVAKPRRKSKGIVVFAIILCSVLVVTLVSFAGVGLYNTISGQNAIDPGDAGPTVNVPVGDLPGLTLQDKPQDSTPIPSEGRLATEQIVEKVSPAIVAITTYADSGYNGYQAEGMGSGIIIRDDGYIVTNAHVIEGSQGITVTLNDGETKYEGRVIGSDSKTDLAVIKVDAEGLASAVFGNSDQTKVGEKVIAIGNPQSMDFAGSVTQGIVSGLNRTLTASGGAGGSTTTYSSLIQTDAAINPGNSGGALVNEFGQIIGINSAKVVTTGAEGMGFAIPSNAAKPIVDDLIAHGRVTGRVMLGIVASPVDEVLGRLNGWPTGLLVQSSQPDSDISKKGVVPGDIITKAAGEQINSFQSLTKVLEQKKPGDSIELEVYRPASRRGQNGKFYTISVKLMEDLGTDTTVQQPNQTTPEEQYPGEQYPGQQYPGEQYPGEQYPSEQYPYDFFDDFFR